MYINFAWFDNFFVDFLVELIASKLVLRINIELEIHNLVCILKIVESYSVLSVLFLQGGSGQFSPESDEHNRNSSDQVI